MRSATIDNNTNCLCSAIMKSSGCEKSWRWALRGEDFVAVTHLLLSLTVSLNGPFGYPIHPSIHRMKWRWCGGGNRNAGDGWVIYGAPLFSLVWLSTTYGRSPACWCVRCVCATSKNAFETKRSIVRNEQHVLRIVPTAINFCLQLQSAKIFKSDNGLGF